MLLKSFNLSYSSGELEQYRWNNTVVIDFARASERACRRGFTLVRAMKLLPLSLLRPPSTIMRPSLLRSCCYVILQRAVLRVPNRLSRTPASCDLMDEDRRKERQDVLSAKITVMRQIGKINGRNAGGARRGRYFRSFDKENDVPTSNCNRIT